MGARTEARFSKNLPWKFINPRNYFSCGISVGAEAAVAASTFLLFDLNPSGDIACLGTPQSSLRNHIFDTSNGGPPSPIETKLPVDC